MATYYTIHMQDLPSGTEHYFSTEVFESFDDACDALDKEIAKHDKNFVKPDRAKMRELTDSPVYHRMPLQMFGLMKRTFVPKKPKYVYRYSVLCTPTPNRHSQLYDSFDEMYDAANKELTELYKTIGKDWNDPETQEESRKNWRWDTTKEGCRKTLEKNNSVQYAYFIDPNGGFKTDTLVVNCGVRTDRFYLDKVAV